jgi:hypothetical protein
LRCLLRNLCGCRGMRGPSRRLCLAAFSWANFLDAARAVGGCAEGAFLALLTSVSVASGAWASLSARAGVTVRLRADFPTFSNRPQNRVRIGLNRPAGASSVCNNLHRSDTARIGSDGFEFPAAYSWACLPALSKPVQVGVKEGQKRRDLPIAAPRDGNHPPLGSAALRAAAGRRGQRRKRSRLQGLQPRFPAMLLPRKWAHLKLPRPHQNTTPTPDKKSGPEEPPTLSFAVTPTKHAYIGCDRGDRLPCIINSLR